MFRRILIHGVIAGLIVGVPMVRFAMSDVDTASMSHSMLLGYLVMLVALSTVFVGIKRHRDLSLGGVIRFWPAFGMGLAISIIASLFYVAAWEVVMAYSGMDFAAEYSKYLLEERKAAGASAAELARTATELASFAKQYADPMFRLPMTFVEIFPVGVLVSLVSAGLLRNPRFLALKRG